MATRDERKAAARAMREQVENDRLIPRAKQQDSAEPAKPKAYPQAQTMKADKSKPASAESQVDEILRRKGGYLRSQSTDHMN